MPDDPSTSPAPRRPGARAEYTPSDLQHLSDLEHVRERPSMYIGDTALRGLHHMVYEVVDNSIDEAMAGFATQVSVTIHPDGSVTVEDDGRGIPVERHPQLSEEFGRDVSTLEGVMTVLKFGGKFQKGAYQTSGGLHGVGVTVVNFLSEWCVCEVRRSGHVYQQEYARGIPSRDVQRIGATDKVGTKTTFKPDALVFETTKFNYGTLHRRLQELAFLNAGVRIVFLDERTGEGDQFKYDQGIIQFVEFLNRTGDAVHKDVIHHKTESEGIELEIALQYTREYTENVHTYVNNINTTEGGTHLTGFRTALTRTLNAYGKREDYFKDLVPTGEDVREGLTAVVSVRVPEPKFEGQTKTKLGNSEVEGLVNSAFGDFFAKYLEENPPVAKAIVKKGLEAAEAREAARKAKELVRDRKKVGFGGGLPGKLRDCTSKEVEKCELYLVEGDSAGGSAEGGRLRETQAILPLRGKIINAYKSREDKVLGNEEIRSMISAIGSGIGPDMDLSKRRYDKIVIMTDADVDGSHIRTLLLTFFYRQMFHLVHGGHVYVAQPPLFRVKRKKETYYVQTEEEMRNQLLELGLADAVLSGEAQPEPPALAAGSSSSLPTALAAGSGTKGAANKTIEIKGEKMVRLCKTLAALEDSIIALERRGIGLREHAARRDAEGRLPVFHVYHGGEEHWFSRRLELDDFLAEREEAAGGELAVDDHDIGSSSGAGILPASSSSPPLPSTGEGRGEGLPSSSSPSSPLPPPSSSSTNGQPRSRERLHIVELHEVRSINSRLAELEALGFTIDALIPKLRTGLENPPFTLRRGESEAGLEHLRALPAAIRAAGEKGLSITRFKGLGEMNAEELRETTLDPANRLLVRITMDEAGAADDMFRILMGDKVEPRREFIEKHALEVKNLDV